MQWTISRNWDSKDKLVAYLSDDRFLGEGYRYLDTSLRDNNLWALIEIHQGRRAGQCFITLFLLSKFDDAEWGYREVCESCGPRETNVPLNFIARCEASGNEGDAYAFQWRERVKRLYAAQKEKTTASNQLVHGDKNGLRGRGSRLLNPLSKCTKVVG